MLIIRGRQTCLMRSFSMSDWQSSNCQYPTFWEWDRTINDVTRYLKVNNVKSLSYRVLFLYNCMIENTNDQCHKINYEQKCCKEATVQRKEINNRGICDHWILYRITLYILYIFLFKTYINKKLTLHYIETRNA